MSSMSGSLSNLSKAAKRQKAGNKGLRVVARTMLVYPISFVAYSIPLTVISLIENYRRSTLNPVVALVLSTLFALRGAIDVLAFGVRFFCLFIFLLNLLSLTYITENRHLLLLVYQTDDAKCIHLEDTTDSSIR
jgi:hypothetical protein